MNEWVWFCGVLLPKGYKDLNYRFVNGTFKPFVKIDDFLDCFTDQPILIEFDSNFQIGKIKSVWKEDDMLMIGGYIKERYSKLEIGISVGVEYDTMSNIVYYTGFGCSLIKQSLYPECKIKEIRRISYLNGGSLPFL